MNDIMFKSVLALIGFPVFRIDFPQLYTFCMEYHPATGIILMPLADKNADYVFSKMEIMF